MGAHIERSHGFDYIVYLQHNPDVQAVTLSSIKAWAGRKASVKIALLYTNGHLAAYPDVANAARLVRDAGSSVSSKNSKTRRPARSKLRLQKHSA